MRVPLRVIRLPRLRRAVPAALGFPVLLLVASGFLGSAPLSAEARPLPPDTVDSIFWPRPTTVTVTSTVTQPPQTVTVTAPPVTSTVTSVVTVPPVTTTVTAPPETVTVTQPPVTKTTTIPVTVTAPPTTVTVTASGPTTTAAGQPAITRSGNQLLRGGQPFRFVGFNDPGLFGCDADSANATEANLDRYFGGLPAASVTRIWPYANSSWSTVLPRVIAAAERHGQYLMPVLADRNGNGSQCGSNAGTAYPADGGAVKTHAAAVVLRFKDAPSIAVWEIINEGPRVASALPWYQSIAAQIRAIDPRAVVAFGMGTCYSALNTAAWNACLTVAGDPANDLIDFHEYDAGPGVSNWTDEHQALASRSGKPWFTGEFGFCCNGAPAGLTSSNMGDMIKREWTNYLNAGASGALYWGFRMNPADSSADHVTFNKPAWLQMQNYTLP